MARTTTGRGLLGSSRPAHLVRYGDAVNIDLLASLVPIIAGGSWGWIGSLMYSARREMRDRYQRPQGVVLHPTERADVLEPIAAARGMVMPGPIELDEELWLAWRPTLSRQRVWEVDVPPGFNRIIADGWLELRVEVMYPRTTIRLVEYHPPTKRTKKRRKPRGGKKMPAWPNFGGAFPSPA